MKNNKKNGSGTPPTTQRQASKRDSLEKEGRKDR